MSVSCLLLAAAVVLVSGCESRARKVSLSGPQLAPMLQAMAAADRAALGFASIPVDAEVLLDDRPSAGCDATLIFRTLALNGSVQHLIGFRKTATGYQWILEQETHPGPKTFIQSGHTAHEWILITYETEPLTGYPPGKLCVGYTGQDSRIADRKDLTLDEVRPILEEWGQKR